MAKITITRLPNATPEYDAGQFDQMIRLLEKVNFRKDEYEITRNVYYTCIYYRVRKQL
jgi:hypothetical protein